MFLAVPAEAVPEPSFLLRVDAGELGRHRWKEAFAVTTVVHVLLAQWVLSQGFAGPVMEDNIQLALRLREPVDLIAPPPGLVRELTGEAGSEGGGPAPAAEEVSLQDLLAEPGSARGEPDPEPEPVVPVPPPEPEPQIVEPSSIEPLEEEPEEEGDTEGAEPPGPPPPAKLPVRAGESPKEQPKLAFEDVRPGTFSRSTQRRSSGVAAHPRPVIPPPPPMGGSVQRAVEEASRGGGGGRGLVIGDIEARGGVFEAREVPPSPGDRGSAVQLLSDPEGVDFRPYLVHVLTAVRRNWQAVMPASAKLGLQGKVIIQFSVDRSGNVPKLVIAIPSGSQPLDRAAVASISASNPFPPLPEEFANDEVRLQLNFFYNMKSR